MKDMLKIMVLAAVFLFIAGTCNSQIVSENGEFSYTYVAKNTLVTSLGDTLYTGHNFPVYISNEGHPYNLVHYGGQDIKVVFSGPWYSPNTMFVEYYNTGDLKQSLLFYADGLETSYFYHSRFGEEAGVIKNNPTRALSLWE